MGIYKKSIKPKALNKKKEQQRDEILNNKIMKQQKFKIGPYYKGFATAHNVFAKGERILLVGFGIMALLKVICAIGMDINKK